MNRTLTPLRWAVLAAASLPLSAFATNGYQLIGVGAYQKSLAGAVTAAPGTAMTAVSNPAGMARIGARTDFSMEAFMPDRSVDFSNMGGDSADSSVTMYGVPAIGWTAPTSDGSDFYFGGGMFGTSGMGVDYAQTSMMPAANMYWEGYSNVSFWQMAPSLAWNVNNKLSVGASLNIDYQSVALKQRLSVDSTGDGNADVPSQTFDLSRGASGFGLGFGIGVLYDVNEQVTVGFNYKSKQQFSPMEYQLGYGDIYNVPGTNCAGGSCPAGTYKLDLDFPQQAAVGVAVHPNKKLTVSADVKWIDWSDTMGKLAVEGPGGITAAINPGWDDQTVYALGVAYELNNKTNLRAGYNYAKSPIGSSDVTSNLILPAIVETHYTMGMDYSLNNHWELAWHYMMVPEKSMTASDKSMGISLSERSFGMNIGYRF